MHLLRYFLLLSVFYFSACAVVPAHHQKFVNRTGETLTVEVNGNVTHFTEKQYWNDAHGVTVDTTYWSVSTDSGALCFRVSATPGGFGKFLQMGITLKEYRSDREMSRWKNYKILPRPVTGLPPEAVWLPGEQFCVEEFLLTHRLRYQKLPSGTYLLTIRYSGEKNWDAQSIKLEIR